MMVVIAQATPPQQGWWYAGHLSVSVHEAVLVEFCESVGVHACLLFYLGRVQEAGATGMWGVV